MLLHKSTLLSLPKRIGVLINQRFEEERICSAPAWPAVFVDSPNGRMVKSLFLLLRDLLALLPIPVASFIHSAKIEWSGAWPKNEERILSLGVRKEIWRGRSRDEASAETRDDSENSLAGGLNSFPFSLRESGLYSWFLKLVFVNAPRGYGIEEFLSYRELVQVFLWI